MNICSSIAADGRGEAPAVERARPLLGTLVSIRVAGLGEGEANRAIERGFAAIAEVHRLMSFHEPGSELSRLNREAARGPVRVGPHTLAVLRHAEEVARASGGAFDVAVAGDLVASGALPRPEGAPEPDPAASWRDIEIGEGGDVRFARNLWIDLGGIAKGYAVDRALAAMGLPDEAQCVVNAGGDLRVAGPLPEAVSLAMTMPGAVPMVEIAQGSLASSTGAARWGASGSVHRHGMSRRPVGVRRFVSVASQSCMTADALTKVVLALGPRAEPVLRQFGARAWLYSARSGWRELGGEDE